jgi:hypothetical protein
MPFDLGEISMKTLAPIAIVVICGLTLASPAQNTKNINLKYNLDYLEKTWGIKLKSPQIDLRGRGGSEIKLLLEFTKDVENVQGMRDAFQPIIITSAKDNRLPKLYFYVFDDDNVSLAKMQITYTQGEVTGKKGDAFRITVGQIGGTDLQKAKKLEVRPAEQVKDKK